MIGGPPAKWFGYVFLVGFIGLIVYILGSVAYSLARMAGWA